MAELTRRRKIVFSSTLDGAPWANTEVLRGDAVKVVAELKQSGLDMTTIGSLTLCRSLLEAGLVDLFRVGVFPVITGRTGRERIYDGYPDVLLDMASSRTFDNRIQLLEYVPRVLDGPPGANASA
jgi:dihydrofolate reductase